jgi:hypothetical protein
MSGKLWEVIIKSYIIRKPCRKRSSIVGNYNHTETLVTHLNAGISMDSQLNSAGNIIMGQCVEAQGAKE